MPVLIASPQGQKGETVAFAEEIISELRRRGFRTKVLMTANMSFAACGGCLACEPKGECIVKDDIQTFQKQLLNGTGLILASPVYLNGPPGRLKCLLDRFWPWSLKPRLFKKYGAVIVISGSFGTRDLAEYLTAVMESWGMNIVGSETTMLMRSDSIERRKKMFIDCRLLARKVAEAVHKRKRLSLSSLGRLFVRNIWSLILNNKDRFEASYDYWRENDIPKKFGL